MENKYDYAICAVKIEDDYNSFTLSPFTMKPCRLYRAAGVMVDKKNNYYSPIQSFIVIPFDAESTYGDFTVLRLRDMMMAEIDGVAMNCRLTDEEQNKALGMINNNMMIAIKAENIDNLGKTPSNALINNDALRLFLITTDYKQC